MKKMTITPKISFIQEGVNKEINRADISAVLYDDGRYEELKDIVMPTTPIENIAVETTTTSTTSYQQSQQTPQVTESLVVPQYVEKGTSANTFNLLAYGQITNGAYVLDHEFDGITIQWRAIIKNGKQVINTDFQYLGTTPYEATQALNIKGLTEDNASEVQILIRVEKDGYMPQIKKYNVQSIIDEKEIVAFYKLVKENEE